MKRILLGVTLLALSSCEPAFAIINCATPEVVMPIAQKKGWTFIEEFFLGRSIKKIPGVPYNPGINKIERWQIWTKNGVTRYVQYKRDFQNQYFCHIHEQYADPRKPEGVYSGTGP